VFKHITVYRIAHPWRADLPALEKALAQTPFTECAATQEKSSGWTPPRDQAHGLLAESVGKQWILRFMTESRLLPSSVVTRKVKEKAARIEQTTGRTPGKKETRALKEETRLDLLPKAFTKQSATWVWIDPKARLLMLDTGTQSRTDEITTALTQALPGLTLALLDTQTSPRAAMAHWLLEQEPPAGFSIDRECELKAVDESKAVVRYAHHPLNIAEVQAHIKAGKLPAKLAMTWNDRVSFVLTESLQLKKLAFLDTVFENQTQDDPGFDADVAIATGELVQLIPDLIDALDGEGHATADGEAPF
jgi:recombination associated protein RdgC